jgi:hypothetical protein
MLTPAGTAFRDLKTDKLYYPTIGVKKPGESLRANFGQEPFAFDIDKMVQAEKMQVQLEVARTKAPHRTEKDKPPLDETAFIHSLVGQYLAHDGYVETARAFAEEVVEEARALANDDDVELSYVEAEEDVDAVNRQSLYLAHVHLYILLTFSQGYVLRSSRATSTKRSNTPTPITRPCYAKTKTYILSYDVASSSK